jgi:hypothetical protein
MEAAIERELEALARRRAPLATTTPASFEPLSTHCVDLLQVFEKFESRGVRDVSPSPPCAGRRVGRKRSAPTRIGDSSSSGTASDEIYLARLVSLGDDLSKPAQRSHLGTATPARAAPVESSMASVVVDSGCPLQLSTIPMHPVPSYYALVNFSPRALYGARHLQFHCVMCGREGVLIPKQNRDVCRECDKATWKHAATGCYFKWCKGCKNFHAIHAFAEAFADMHNASKCDKCRRRSRVAYMRRKDAPPGAPDGPPATPAPAIVAAAALGEPVAPLPPDLVLTWSTRAPTRKALRYLEHDDKRNAKASLGNYLVKMGGTRELVTDWTIGKYRCGNTVYIAPNGRVLRSKPEVARYLRASNPTSGLREIL